MSKPSSRQELIDYCLRRLGAPVLEINVADEQIDDLVDDALQYFQERHFDGVERMYLKHQLTPTERNNAKSGLTTTTATVGITTYYYQEGLNYIQVPDSVIGIDGIWKFNTNSISGSFFNLQYQLFLNDLYYFSSIDILHYSMIKRYIEDINWVLGADKKIRFNKRQGRLYLDIDWGNIQENEWIIIDCYRVLDPNENTKIYNDSFLKKYLTTLIKRQWGQNLIKFQGVKLPGGVELNGRQIYEDAEKELEQIKQVMALEHELPPLDMIG